MKSVVVTGVSTGIGHATAKVLLGQGFRVFGSVRKQADADRLAGEFGANFIALIFDVIDEAAVAAGAAKVRDALGADTLAGLVNNAGISVPGPLLGVPVAEFRRQLETNVIGQVIVTQAFAPLLGTEAARKGPPGRIVMISSVAGKSALPFAGPYAASKHAVEAIAESLRRELMLFGIDVIVIGPGPIRTAIWDKGEAIDFSSYGNTPYMEPMKRLRAAMLAMGKSGLPAEDVGRLVHHALTAASPRVRYTSTPGKLQRLVYSLMPKRMQDRVLAKRLGLTRQGA